MHSLVVVAVSYTHLDISAGSNVAFQVLYKNIEIMQIKDGTSWSLTPKITVKKGEESEVKETTPLKGKIDTQINLTNVKKSPYTTGKSYYPGIYTKKQLQKTVFKVDQKSLDHFDDYYFCLLYTSFYPVRWLQDDNLQQQQL